MNREVTMGDETRIKLRNTYRGHNGLGDMTLNTRRTWEQSGETRHVDTHTHKALH